MLLSLPTLFTLAAGVHLAHAAAGRVTYKLGERATDWHKPPQPPHAYRNAQCYRKTFSGERTMIDVGKTQGCCNTIQNQPDSVRFYEKENLNGDDFHCSPPVHSRDSIDAAEFARCCGANHPTEACCTKPQHQLDGAMVCEAPDPAAEGHIADEWSKCDPWDRREGLGVGIRVAWFYGDGQEPSLLAFDNVNQWRHDVTTPKDFLDNRGYLGSEGPLGEALEKTGQFE
ncbi:MAG: hypothetical protein M1837_003235 [Sclerophora amabilis]|nr:MAG: hypothetical protein M1837_003235 [Sclerophora amabilis]